MELSELVRKAQNAMDRGDYALAAGACAHALAAYPNCLSAQRILGESLLEQGQAKTAVEHFERALTLDPLSVVARLGLGVASEELKDAGLAYAHYLHAWEINPALDQVRGQLVRLRATLGSHDRLHPTRAGLAGVHARGGQFGRAAAEWRALLAVDPDSARAQTSLAEVLWRAGDDIGAATLCKHLLEQAPDNARAVAMLAEIEKRQGSTNVAELVRRYQAIDPIGEVALLMSEYRPNTDLAFLTANALDITEYDFAAVAAEMPTPATSAPASSPALVASHVAAPDLWDNLVRDLQHDTDDTSDPESSDLQPFSWSDDGAGFDLNPVVEPFSLDNLTEPMAASKPAPAPVEPSFDALVAESAPAPVVADDDRLVEIKTARPPVAPAPVLEPVPVAKTVVEPPVAARTAAPVADPFVTADGRVDLTIGWDEIDRVLQEATPSGGDTSGYDDLLAELDAGGAAPFAADDGVDNSAWEPFSADEFADTATPVAPAIVPVESPEPVDEIVQIAPATNTWPVDDSVAMDLTSPENWDDFEEDLISAIPSPQPSGYTELLRHVDNEELAGLADLYDDEVDPLFNPDSSGDPLEFEALLSVTSRDGTAELLPVASVAESASVAPLVAEAEPEVDDIDFDLPAFVWADDAEAGVPNQSAELAPDGENGELNISLGEIEPFSFDDLLAFRSEDERPGTGGAESQYGDLEEVFAQAAHVVDIPVDVQAATFTQTPEPISEFGIAVVPDAAEAFDWSSVVADEPVPVLAAVQVQADHQLSMSDDAPRWPTFVGHTSELIDREPVGLFDRLRARKRALQADGTVVVDRVVATRPQRTPDVSIPDAVDEIVRPVTRPRLATVDGLPVDRDPIEERGLDLTRMRIRLIESESAAAEIASTLEDAIARGDTEPLTLRVLGEAYLRLGRTEQAAAQFRESMLARRRVR